MLIDNCWCVHIYRVQWHLVKVELISIILESWEKALKGNTPVRQTRVNVNVNLQSNINCF